VLHFRFESALQKIERNNPLHYAAGLASLCFSTAQKLNLNEP